MTKISIVGATTWGTTLAIVNAIGNQENEIFLLTRSQDETTKLENENQNSKFLPGYSFPNNINITNSKHEALENTDLVILAVPSITFRENLTNIKDFISSNSILLSATKGIEISSGLRMTQIIKNEISNVSDQNICVLSGPNLAKEIIQGKPCSSVVASSDENTINTVQEILNSELFRLYGNTDIIGVEIAGAMKNITAIASGISDGLNFGDNAKSSLITRGLAEMTRLGVAMGAKQSTFSGLAGMGDLIATCSSPQSRNTQLGMRLGQGETLKNIQSSMVNVAEGVSTTKAVINISKSMKINMPLAEAVFKVLFENIKPLDAYKSLMNRTTKLEI